MKRSKVLLLLVCLILIAAISVLGTVAFFTDKDTDVNTFAVGQVKITLDEAAVDINGKIIEGADRVKGNEYHLIPGSTYIKDPRLTVERGSQEAYVRMLVTFNKLNELNEIFAPNGAELTSIFNGYDETKWIYNGKQTNVYDNTVTYEFRYFETVDGNDGALEPLFESFTLPLNIDGDDLKSIQGFEITVLGNAIQKSGFSSEDAAWAGFEQQIKK